jgi:PAS domain S-box-containing protein
MKDSSGTNTELKSTSEALDGIEERFSSFFRSIPDALVISRMQDGKIVEINDRWREVFGYIREEVIGKSSLTLNLLADSSDHQRILALLREQGFVRNLELQIRQKSGALRTATLSIESLEMHGDRYLLNIIQDITERKRSEAKLWQQTDAMEASIDGIAILNEMGEYVYLNKAHAQIYGYDDAGELIGKSWKVFYDSDELQRFEQEIMPEFGRKGNWRGEAIGMKKDGSKFPQEVSLTAMVDGGLVCVVRDITVHKRAETALRESEEKYRLMAENMADIISVLDTNLRFTYVSPSILHILGFTVEEAMEQTLDQIMTPESMKIALTALEEEMKVEASGTADPNRIHTIEMEIYRKDGSLIWVENRLSYLRGKDHKPVSILAVTRNITERMQTEKTLSKSEEYFRAITENASDVVFIVDALGTITYASPSIRRFTGFNPEELIGSSGFDLISPDDLPRAIEDFGKVIQIKEVAIPNGFRIRHKDGTERIFEGVGMNLLDNPAVGGFVMNVRDVTDRKRAEEDLRESEIMLRSVFTAVPLAIAVVDTDKVVKNINDGMTEMFGYPRDEMIGRNVRFLYFSDEEYKKTGEVLYGNPVTVGNSAIEVRMRRKDGAEIWVLLSASSLRSEDASTGAVIACMDITARKFLEAQLRQAQKMEAIGTLSGGIAHDFNNILSAIMGYTDMALQEPGINDELRHYLSQVFKAGERAKDLVKQILAFSRQSDQNSHPTKVGLIVKEVLKLLRASLPTTITICQDIQSTPDTVFADPSQIHQIIMNLCTNAAHAMRNTKGELKISLAPVEVYSGNISLIYHDLSPGKYLNLSVSDTGSGIAPDIMDRIFDPFFTTKNPGEGTGMGLSVVHGIVKNCHGAITVESKVGKGTEFRVYLPLLNEKEEEQEIDAVAHIRGGNERILFVDDEEALVQLGKYMLTDLGYEVVERTGSLEALELFQAKPDHFDLVITDMTMPKMTGIELAQEIMRIRPGMPIILCTGFSETITPEKAKALGLREMIMKPVSQRQIAATIRCALDKKE